MAKKNSLILPQNIKALEIKIWGDVVGYLTVNNDKIYFEYDDGFKAKNIELSPLELPIKTTTIYSSEKKGNTFKGLPGIFADCLPDNFGQNIINHYFLHHFGILSSDVTPIMSLAYLSNRALGALEFYPQLEIAKTKSTLNENTNLSDLIFAVKKSMEGNAKAVINEIISVGSSAGGIHAKAAIDYNPLTNELRLGFKEPKPGFIPSILKFDGIRDGDLAGFDGKNEYIYNLIAKDCGLKITPFYLIAGEAIDGEGLAPMHFLSTRFDRDLNKNKPYHIATFCGLSLFDFRQHNSSSYESLLRVTNALCTSDITQTEELFKRCVFNVVLRNEDDHTKNFSFLMDREGVWSVAPAYDLNYVIAKNGHQLSVNGKNQNITVDDLLALAGSAQIKMKSARLIIDEVITSSRKYLDFAASTNLDENFANGIFKNFALIK